MNWRNQIDPAIKAHIEARIKQSSENRDAVLSAKNPREAQLWIALGNLSKEITEAKLKLKYLEKALADAMQTKKKKTMSKKEQKEIDDVMKTIRRL